MTSTSTVTLTVPSSKSSNVKLHFLRFKQRFRKSNRVFGVRSSKKSFVDQTDYDIIHTRSKNLHIEFMGASDMKACEHWFGDPQRGAQEFNRIITRQHT
jgi:hypothetical protein